VASRRKHRPMAEINVVPYIDVMLVLLIIFMITAPIVQQGVEIELPRPNVAAKQMSPDQHEPVVVAVDQKGDFYLNIGDQPDKPIEAELLVNRVAAVRQLKPDVPVLVRGDRGAGYGQVVDAMVLLQKAGVEKVGLMTDQPDN